MKTVTAATIIRKLRQLFSQFGIPEVVVSDNGPQFSAQEFEKFCHLNGIYHVPVDPYHPLSNGLAEKAVQVVKQGIKKLTSGTLYQDSCSSIESHLTRQPECHQRMCYCDRGFVHALTYFN